MERNIRNEVDKGENFRDALAKNEPLSIIAATELDSELRRLDLSFLHTLCHCLREQNACTQVYARLAHPLGFEQLEMFEAELRNQGIVSGPDECSLSRKAAHEATVWRWRAERLGISGERLHFSVLVPEYTLFRTAELIDALQQGSYLKKGSRTQLQRSNVWRRKFENHRTIVQEIQYLERLAEYMAGGFDEASNRYQQGLNVVLKVLVKESMAESDDARSNDELVVSLPISKNAFNEQVKEFRGASADSLNAV